MTIPESITIRPYTDSDLPALVDLINRAVAFDSEDQFVTLDALRARAERFYVTPQDNWFVAITPEGRLVGWATAEIDPRIGRGWADCRIDPDFRRQGIGTRLLTAADDRFRARAEAELVPGMPLIVARFASETNAAARALLERAGYEAVRRSWFMRISLADPIDAPALPEGITFRPLDWERDSRAVFEAQEDIFRDNWGYTPPPFELWQEISLKEFPFGGSMWLIAVDSAGQIVGLCLPRPKSFDDASIGWIDSVGVRASYRRRGLGSILLRHGFRVLREHGFTTAELEVDSENSTNAVALYERARMHTYRCYLVHRKAIRGDQSLIWKP